MKLDHKTTVPIGWVLSGACIMLGVVVTGAFWVSMVNFRLGRIEEKLGIPPLYSSMTPIETAHASEKYNANKK